MVGLTNLSPHLDGAVDMPATGLWREIIPNVRDRVLVRSANVVGTLDVSAGGTFVLSTEFRYAKQLIRLTGSPAAAFTIEMADGGKQMEYENTTGQTATIESTTGAASPPAVPAGTTMLLQLRGTDFTILGIVGLQVGALLHSGTVPPTATISFLDFKITRAKFVDQGFKTTSPTVSGGTLTLDVELGNYFDVTLTGNVTTLNLNNALGSAAVIIVFIARQDATGSRVITWPGTVNWERDTGGSPAQSSTANAVDIYKLLTVDGGTAWQGFVLGLDMK